MVSDNKIEMDAEKNDLSYSYESVYQNHKPVYDIKTGKFPQNRIEAIVYNVNKLGLGGSEKSVLDIGCGNGLLLYNLRTEFNELCGLELSKNRADCAEKNLCSLDPKIICGDFLLHNFNRQYDVIVCADVIEHIPDVFEFFRKANLLIKDDGYLLINTPNVMYFRNRIKFLFGRFPSTALGNEGMDVRTNQELYDSGHLHYFNYSVLRMMAKRFGFQVIKEMGIGRLRRVHNLYPPLTSGSCNIVLRKISNDI